MLHGFRVILLIGVFLAIAGSVQSGDWLYSVWIVLALSSVLLITFILPDNENQESGEQSDTQKDSFILLLSSNSYLSEKYDSKATSTPLSSKRFKY
jgi:hypothetical protein